MGVSPASLSRDGARAKRNETDPTRIEEILRQVRLKSGLTLAGGLGPLLHGGLHAAVHIFGSDVFDMLRQTPDVTERIALESSVNTLTKVQSATIDSLREGVAVFGPDGKLKLHINVNETGTVLLVDAEPGGAADDAVLVSCLGDAIKGAHFPKPPGMATITAPLVFRP